MNATHTEGQIKNLERKLIEVMKTLGPSEFSRLTHKNVSAISDYASGRKKMSANMIIDLAKKAGL